MPTTHVKQSNSLEKTIMAKVASNEIVMKPKWYFAIGAILTMLSVVGVTLGAVFLTNLTLFLLRKHGPMGQWRLQQLIDSFPLWIPLLAIIGMVLGIRILRSYDFSYKKNFGVIVASFILTVILSAFIIDRLGLNDIWFRHGPMRRFYDTIERNQNKNPLQRGNQILLNDTF